MTRISRMTMAAAMIGGIAAGAAWAMPTTRYLEKAGAGDLYEIRSSEMVSATTRNPQLRDFARDMVADHSKSTADVAAAARASGMRPGQPMLSPMQRRMMSELRAARGPMRDRVYLRQQADAHREALMLHRDYAATGSSRPLRRTAAGIVPVVEHHIAMLRDMR